MSIIDTIIGKLLLRPVPDVKKLYKNSRVEKEFEEILEILSQWGNNTAS